MLKKCANPSCSTPFIYLREGKIFMMEHSSHLPVRPHGLGAAKSAASVEHFWLCGRCSAEMTITYDGSSIAVVPKSRSRQTAA